MSKPVVFTRAEIHKIAGMIPLRCPECDTETVHDIDSGMKGPLTYPCNECGAPWMGNYDLQRDALCFWPPVQSGEFGPWLPDLSPFLAEKPEEPEAEKPTAEDLAIAWENCAHAWHSAASRCGREGDWAREATSLAYAAQADAMALDVRYRDNALAEALERQAKAERNLIETIREEGYDA